VEVYLALDSDLVVTGSARAKCQRVEILSVCGIDGDEGEEVAGEFDVVHAWGYRIA